MVLMNLSTGQQWRNKHREQICGHVGRGGERVRCMERVTWKLTIPYGKEMANRNLRYDSGNSNMGCVTIYKGETGKEMEGRLRREGTWMYLWLILVDVQQETKIL